jgi:hypothetical protein
MIQRTLLSFFSISIFFQLTMSMGLYFLVYVEPIPELIKTGIDLLQNSASIESSAGKVSLVRTFITDTVKAEQATAKLLSTIATILLICALIQISVLVGIWKTKRKHQKKWGQIPSCKSSFRAEKSASKGNPDLITA